MSDEVSSRPDDSRPDDSRPDDSRPANSRPDDSRPANSRPDDSRPADSFIAELPKAELHVHLDGSLRPESMIELARERGVALPAYTPVALAEAMYVSDASNLVEYLKGFELTLSMMQDSESISRITREIVEDSARDGARYVEIRYCPFLHTQGGLDNDGVIAAVRTGLREGEELTGCRAQALIAALRSLPAEHSLEMAEAVISNHGRAACAFDIAGPEAGHPVRDHAEAFRRVRDAGVPTTIHAGEAWGPDSIRQAIEEGFATRIGHGTRLPEDPELLFRIRELGIVLEVCQTSNVQTGVARSHAEHPLRLLHEEGVKVSICTDNHLMSGVTLVDEYRHARDDLLLGADALVAIARTGFEAAFLPEAERDRLISEVWEESAKG